jgi:hypothetical protein
MPISTILTVSDSAPYAGFLRSTSAAAAELPISPRSQSLPQGMDRVSRMGLAEEQIMLPQEGHMADPHSVFAPPFMGLPGAIASLSQPWA